MSLSAEQEADCQEAFTLFDRSGAGKLKLPEVPLVLRALGHNLAGEELKDALKPIGAKKEVTLADFKSVMAGLTDTTPTKDIVNAFKVFDKDNDGSCNRDELASALCSMGDKLTGDQVEEMLQDVPVDGNGNFKYVDFVKQYRSDA